MKQLDFSPIVELIWDQRVTLTNSTCAAHESFSLGRQWNVRCLPKFKIAMRHGGWERPGLPSKIVRRVFQCSRALLCIAQAGREAWRLANAKAAADAILHHGRPRHTASAFKMQQCRSRAMRDRGPHLPQQFSHSANQIPVYEPRNVRPLHVDFNDVPNTPWLTYLG